MRKDEKKELIDELREKFSRARVAVLTGYTGINVEQITDLRTKLSRSKVEPSASITTARSTALPRSVSASSISRTRRGARGAAPLWTESTTGSRPPCARRSS